MRIYFDLLDGDVLTPASSVLDVGCGTGRWIQVIAPRAGQIVGVDPSKAVAAAAARLDGVANVRLVKASVLSGTNLTGGFKRQADGMDGVFLGLEIPLPIADRRSGAVDAAQAEIKVAESEVDLLRRAIARQVLLASSRLQIAQRQLEFLGPTGVDEAGEILSLARLSFAEGEMRAFDLLDAARAYIEARLLESQVRGDLWSSYFELERAVGGFLDHNDNGVSER